VSECDRERVQAESERECVCRQYEWERVRERQAGCRFHLELHPNTHRQTRWPGGWGRRKRKGKRN